MGSQVDRASGRGTVVLEAEGHGGDEVSGSMTRSRTCIMRQVAPELTSTMGFTMSLPRDAGGPHQLALHRQGSYTTSWYTTRQPGVTV